MKQKKKSPLKDKALRYAGQSLDERIDKLFNEQAFPYYIVGVFFLLLAGYEWWRYLTSLPPIPWQMTLVAILVLPFCIYNVMRILKEIQSIKLGRDGERVVGQCLEALRENGHRVFHDIVGDGFNLDHVIVSTKGIYAIETKTYSKPVKGNQEIVFDGKKIAVPGIGVISKPIVQVNSEASWLKNMVKESTGKEFFVKPVVLFPEWYVKSVDEAKKSNVWVLNPKAFLDWFNKQQEVIAREDMMLVVFHISRYAGSRE